MPPRYFQEGSKICIICNDTFPRPSGKSNKVWEAQKCCGNNCSAISRRKDTANNYNKSIRKELIPGGARYKGWSGGKLKEKYKFGGMIKGDY